MSIGPTHRIIAALAVSGTLVHLEHGGKQTGMPLIGGALAAFLTNLPDMLEPAAHPNHCQFFHSLAFAAAVGLGWRKLYLWQPEDEAQKLLRFALQVGCAAYLVHLSLDASTSRSLPIVGKI